MKSWLKNRCPSLYPFGSKIVRVVSLAFAELIQDHPRIWLILKACIIGFPATLLSFATLKLPAKPPGQDSLLEWIALNPRIVFVIISWPILMQVVFSIVEYMLDFRRVEQDMERKRHTALYTAIEEVVGKKCKRISEIAHRIRQGTGPRTKEEAFDALMHADDQIEHLAEALYTVVNFLADTKPASTDVVKIVLTDVKDGVPSSFRVHLPSSSTPKSGMLDHGSARKTFWGRTATSREPHVIEDIAFHLSPAGPKAKLYVKSDDGSTDRGSIAAIPVIHPKTDKVIFVLSLKSTRPHLITADLVNNLVTVRNAFINRLLLEYDLEFIKQRMSA